VVLLSRVEDNEGVEEEWL